MDELIRGYREGMIPEAELFARMLTLYEREHGRVEIALTEAKSLK